MERSIGENVEAVRARIAAAAKRSGRDPSEVTLIAVSKTVGSEQVREAFEAGVRHFGENRAQELLLKRSQLDLGCTWHFIGHLQTNKAKDALTHANLIHSVDSLALASELGRRAAALGVTANILAQINISHEETKSGVAPEEAGAFIEALSGLPHIIVHGLMTIAAPTETPEDVRADFRRMKGIFDALAGRALPSVKMEHLSMGMSGDFEVAIEEGATMVRVGTAIFGPRQYL